MVVTFAEIWSIYFVVLFSSISQDKAEGTNRFFLYNFFSWDSEKFHAFLFEQEAVLLKLFSQSFMSFCFSGEAYCFWNTGFLIDVDLVDSGNKL